MHPMSSQRVVIRDHPQEQQQRADDHAEGNIKRNGPFCLFDFSGNKLSRRRNKKPCPLFLFFLCHSGQLAADHQAKHVGNQADDEGIQINGKRDLGADDLHDGAAEEAAEHPAEGSRLCGSLAPDRRDADGEPGAHDHRAAQQHDDVDLRGIQIGQKHDDHDDHNDRDPACAQLLFVVVDLHDIVRHRGPDQRKEGRGGRDTSREDTIGAILSLIFPFTNAVRIGSN